MPLMPKRVKHRNVHKGSRKGIAHTCNTLAFGEFGLKSLTRGWVSNIEMEACRVAVNRHLKKRGKLWVRIFPDKPVTKKPIETRMGKGKGALEYWVAVIRPGTVIFELGGVNERLALEALSLADAKLSVNTKMITRRDR